MISNSEGLFRISSDVTVQQSDEGDLIVASFEPRTPGEELTLEVVNGTSVKTLVRVLESRPMIVSGSVRYRLRLTSLGSEGGSPTGGTQ